MPDPTEQAILAQTLLPPSALQTIIDLKTFAALFPQALRDHPQVAVLYRNLQHQRNLDLDHVRDNIAEEARQGEIQRRDLAKARWRDARGGQMPSYSTSGGEAQEREGDMEGLLYGSNDGSQPKVHTLATIVPALETACENLSTEVSELEAESQRLLEQLQATISDLSDLRYGKLGRASLRKEALDSLKAIDAECDKIRD